MFGLKIFFVVNLCMALSFDPKGLLRLHHLSNMKKGFAIDPIEKDDISMDTEDLGGQTAELEAAIADMQQSGENTELLIDDVVNPMSNQAFQSPVFVDQPEYEALGPGMFQPDTTLQDNLVSEQFQNRDMMEKMSQMPVDRMYNALIQAEHRGPIDNPDYDPFIRTKATGTGSSAYGPVQMTSGKNSMVMRALENPALAKEIGLTEDDIAYAQEFASQGANFLKYGGGDWKNYGQEGLDAKDMYEYGGSGNLTSDEDRASYESLAKKFIGFEMKRAGGDIDKFIKSWRGRTEDQDKDYYDIVRDFY